ncbi:MAG TPA: MATE family efflux transporter [Desulfobacteraceae bacterium]|nr:MATE family efflux transporter [Desulfobacteraceae bacterium]
MEETTEQTKGVKTLLGDPKKAIIKLSIPMVAAMSAHTIYNLVDAIWVSGKGPESLSAVGFSFPFLFLAMAIANGIGIGGGSAISRRIGATDKKGADSIATHTIIIMLVFSGFFTSAMLLLAQPVLRIMGAGCALDLSVTYARIMFSGIVFIFFMQVAVAILRSEGDVKRAMYAMMAGAILNIALDPIFIYTLGLGVAGAAWATILSMFLVSIITFYWLFIEKKTYISFKFKGFRFEKEALIDIARVGFPASVSQASMSLMAFALTTIVASVGGPDGVAVYTTGWRVISLAILPMLGVASAVTSVTGAAFGAQDYKKVEISYMYAIKAGVLTESVLALGIFIFAAQITWIFTWSKESARLVGDLTLFLRVLWLLLPTVAFGMLSSAMFQGVGKGLSALIMTIIRTLVFTAPFAWFLGIYLDWGLLGVWIGMVAAGISYIPIAFGWATFYIRSVQK